MSKKVYFVYMKDAPTWKPDVPWNSLPTLPPARDLQSPTMLKACIEARVALAELRQAAALMPNMGVLINTIPLLEARVSSEIENIVTTTDRLFRFVAEDAAADEATKEALRYRAALYAGYNSLKVRPLATATAISVCSIIKDRDMEIRKVPGTALASDRLGTVIYTPPEGEQRLRELLANWERFLHENTEIDPLIRMAVGHYQFEAIHPFSDGNGRTGRILNILYLIQENLLDVPILYLSRYIIDRKSSYYELLLDVTKNGAWEAWTMFMIDAVRETAQWTKEKILSIRDLEELTANIVRELAPKIYSRELITTIFEQPYCRIDNVISTIGVQRQTASKYLKTLVEIGVLNEQRAGKEKLFINPALMKLLASDDRRSEIHQ